MVARLAGVFGEPAGVTPCAGLKKAVAEGIVDPADYDGNRRKQEFLTSTERFEELLELWRSERRRLGIVVPTDL